MADDRLNLEARFKDQASAGVRKLGKTLEAVRPSHGMAAAQKWMETFHKGADKTVAAVRPVSGLLNSVGVGGLAASLSIGEMIKQFRELADSTLTLKELGRQSRMSATEIARLQYAAGRMHVDPAAMNGAIGSWSSKMVEFRMHTSQFYRDLMRQNADVASKIESDSPIDGLKRALDFISRIKDPQIQKRWADDAGLGDIVPMLGKGPDGLAAAFAEAGREVKPITQEMQDAADRFNEATNRFNQTWSNFKNDLGPSILDPLSHTLDKLDEGMKWAAKYPGDAAAAAATIAGSFAALYARHRLMRGSKLAGGSELGVVAGELGGAAKEQAKAGGSLLEAAIELKAAAAELRGRGGGPGGTPGGPATGEPGKPGSSSPGLVDLKGRGLFSAFQLLNVVADSPGLDADGERRRDANKAALDALGNPIDGITDRLFGKGRKAGDALADWWGGTGPSASDKWRAPSAYGREARARALGPIDHSPNTDGNALHRNDEMPAAVTAQQLFATVREGSKDGIVAGLREMAQQTELGGGSGGLGIGPGDGGGGRRGGGAGMPNMRYGRPSAGGQYRHGPGAQAGDPAGAFNPRQPEKSGMYRPEYKLGAADLDDRVVNTIAGEAVTSNPESIDAVVNNMLNRVGSKGWGPSGNLLDVSRAPGQYAGYRKADPATAERIRARIRAIASGGVPDNTNGSNAYRAAWYHGPWYRQHAADGRVVGGNRFAYEPWTKNEPYAPYPAAKTAADAFAARQKALKGTPPQAHATGGPIRGPGGPRSDSIPAWLSNGEFVVNAGAAGRFLPLLHAINGGHLPAFADGGPVGFGVDQRFYPKFTPGISAAEGRSNRRNWREFFRRSTAAGGMGASWRTTFASLAMLAGESGYGLNAKTYGWDANGPSGGVEQWHDVTKGRWAGKIRRLSNLMQFAMLQHADWTDPLVQQAFKRHEDTTSFAGAWRRMLAAKSARGALKEGIDHIEIPADKDGELRRRLPNIVRLQREAVADGVAGRRDIDPIEVNIRHHPHTGRPVVTARAGRGVKLGIRTAPTMRPT